jgi:formylglycine-generating enzyme required for sulfatase activity
MPVPGAARRDPTLVRKRAIHLLEEFFRNDDVATRRTVFRQALDGLSPDPCGHVKFSENLADFSAGAVDTLLAFGCAGRGRHALALLIETMREVRGRQSDPDYSDLPRELHSLCALPTREEEHGYLQRLLEQAERKARLYSPLRGTARIRPNSSPQPSLLRPWQDDPDIALLRHRSRKATVEPVQRDYDDILSAFAGVPRAALLGAPGAGKSTTLRKLAVELGRRAQAEADAPLPLLAALGDWVGDEPLPAFLATAAPEIGWALDALGCAGRVVLLLDGLNEMPTQARAAKAAAIRALRAKLPAGVPLIVSCRAEDYIGDLDLGLDTLALEPLSPQRIRAAVRQWVTADGQPGEVADRFFWQLAGDPSLAALLDKWMAAGASEEQFWTANDPQDHQGVYGKTSGTEDELWRRCIGSPRSLLKLASNPFLLTMLFQVWVDEDGVLPRNRGDLFQRFILRLLSREQLVERDASTEEWRVKSEGERLLAGLAGLAWRMQRETPGAGVLTVMPRAAVMEALGGEPLLKKALDATLLEGTDELRFRHQLLQEYFTARALEDRLDRTSAQELWPPQRWWERTGWEETAVLLAGFSGGDCTHVIEWLAEAQPEVAAQCILESGAEMADREGVLRRLQRAWLPWLTDLQREPQPEGRAAIGRALGRLGLDCRKGVGQTAEGLPDIDWVEIPRGEFLYQEGERRKMAAFRMGRYPVTNAQFQAFLDAEDGYRQDRWWRGMDAPDRGPGQSSWTELNHPRETVNWWEAVAFCGWLGNRLGRDVRLPTEQEWERAARGRDGREYPWGKEYRAGFANINETYGEAGPHNLGRTSAVGIYPQGASPEGVLDLSGNVWEWCLNEYEKPEPTGLGGRESRALRGGSWGGIQAYARASARIHNLPSVRNIFIGFRVVCFSPIAGR